LTPLILSVLIAHTLSATPPDLTSPDPSPLAVHADLFASDLQPLNLKLTAGTRSFYGMLQVGAGRGQQFVAGTGLGVHLGEKLWSDVDATCSIVQALTGAQETDLVMQLRLSLGVQVHPSVSFFLGPTLNAEVSFAPNAIIRGSALAPLVLLAPPSGGGGWQFWAGLHAGVRL